jgi:hypothetical protein
LPKFKQQQGKKKKTKERRKRSSKIEKEDHTTKGYDS